MIAIIGLPFYATAADGTGRAGGLAVDVALAARRRGAGVELLGKVGDDGAGDEVVLALGSAGIGHAAMLRDPAHPTPVLAAAVGDEAASPEPTGPDEAAGLLGEARTVDEPPAARLLPEDPGARPSLDEGDVDLALRYLPGARVIVACDLLPGPAVDVVVRDASYSGAALVLLVRPGAEVPPSAGEAIVLELPDRDDGSFANLVGFLAAALEAGGEPSAAFAEAVESSGWERVGG